MRALTNTHMTATGRIRVMRRSGLRTLGLLGVLAALVVLFSLTSPYFLTGGNVSDLLLSVSVIGTMAAVSTLVIIGRGIDLSLGSICALTSMVTGLTIEQLHWNWPLGMLAGLLAGALCGSFNGWIIAWLRINPIITTIGTLSVFRGLAYVLSDGQPVLVQSSAVLYLGAGRILALPLSVWILALVFLCSNFVAWKTSVGRAVFAIGASPRAAMVSGLSVSLYRFWLSVASGVSAACAGILMTGQSGTATPGSATGYELWVITAVLLGGTSLRGGEGSVVRTALGVLIIGVLNNGMVLLAIPTFYQIIANGMLLLVAVAIDRFGRGGGRQLEEL
jgi:ribose/xylose/arabinose/galactoside ABC-type transport system permease subunit